MKWIFSAIIVSLLIGCGGGDIEEEEQIAKINPPKCSSAPNTCK